MRLILEWTLLDWDLIPAMWRNYYREEEKEMFGVCYSFLFISLWIIRT